MQMQMFVFPSLHFSSQNRASSFSIYILVARLAERHTCVTHNKWYYLHYIYIFHIQHIYLVCLAAWSVLRVVMCARVPWPAVRVREFASVTPNYPVKKTNVFYALRILIPSIRSFTYYSIHFKLYIFLPNMSFTSMFLASVSRRLLSHRTKYYQMVERTMRISIK